MYSTLARFALSLRKRDKQCENISPYKNNYFVFPAENGQIEGSEKTTSAFTTFGLSPESGELTAWNQPFASPLPVLYLFYTVRGDWAYNSSLRHKSYINYRCRLPYIDLHLPVYLEIAKEQHVLKVIEDQDFSRKDYLVVGEASKGKDFFCIRLKSNLSSPSSCKFSR